MTARLTSQGVNWDDDLSDIELWNEGEPPVRASGGIDAWFDGEDEIPVVDMDGGVNFFAYTYWRPRSKQ